MNQPRGDQSDQKPEEQTIHPSCFILHPSDDPSFGQQVQRLHQLTVYGRWLVAGLLWITVGPLSLWGLRYPISLMWEHFTWAALRYGLFYNPVPTLGLAFCVGMTVSVLVWQSRNILLGMPHREQQRLEQQVCQIRRQGKTHPLWKWVCQ
ncbi:MULTISPECIES: hypothetical protein [Cyanophyceae]|uniref:hypothetical protein n=1 Tax=Cyanophyceae TaxID=3028117 RepID=UPI001F558EDF|nr:hypothetical protein [Trichocoleus sp. FACHB-69]